MLATVGERAHWGATEHLLAAVIDVIQAGNWLFASAHSRTKVPRPKPMARPGDVDPDRIGRSRGYSIEELKRRLAESNGPNSPYIEVHATTL